MTAGWLLGGVALPWTIGWALVIIRGPNRAAPLVVGESWFALLVGAVLIALAVLTAARRSPGVGRAVGTAPAGPRGRNFGDVGSATRAPAFIGPFGVSEVALLAALVTTWLVVGLLLPRSLPEVVRMAILAIVGAAVGTEAFVRAMPKLAREAFEAFSWLGEWEVAQVRARTGSGVPTTQRAARRWLLAHADPRQERDLDWMRVEMLTFVKRFDEARAAAEGMPDGDAKERADRAVARDFADWFAGGEGDLAGIEAAAAEVLPPDGDPRMRIEVAIALARVRRLMAAGKDPLEAGEPLRDMRARLGRRADGQAGRALRGRMFRALLVCNAVFALLSLALPDVSPIR